MSELPDDEAFRARIVGFREEVALRAKVLREHGLEVNAFLEDCDRMTALLDGRGEPGFNAQNFR